MKKITFFILFFYFFSIKAQINTQDSLALLALYQTTNGVNWNTTWDLNDPVGSWNGVDTANGRVVEIDLNTNNLRGSIPPELAALTALIDLELYENQLTGSIPPELGNLTNLEDLELFENQLTGSIPPELGNLTNLEDLELYENQLTGSIPPELGNLMNLRDLDLAENQLTGSIPPELGNLMNLRDLELFENQLTGSIPPELGNLMNLRDLELFENQLTGSIPPELGNLTDLGTLLLQDNQFTDLPDLAHLTGLSGSFDFRVENNFLDFEDIQPNLANLRTSSNYSSQGPVREGQNYDNALGTDLVLSVQVNGTGNVYKWFLNGIAIGGANNTSLNLTNIQEVNLGLYYCEIRNPNVPALILSSSSDRISKNSSTSPSSLASDSLALLALYNSAGGADWNSNWDLNDPVGDWSGVDTANGRVVELELRNEDLNGTIPPELGNLTALERLELEENQLTGSIPPELGNLTNLQILYLYENQLTGSIPPELGNLTNLQELYLYDNELTGSIPPELGNLTNLQELYLYDNQLTGSIPPELGNLTALERLELDNNELTGSIPPELGNLTALERLHLYDNQLTDLPDLAHLTGLNASNDFRVENNFLDFEDIEPNLANLVSASNYSPQRPVREGQIYSNPLGTDIVFSVEVNGTGNVYQWFLNGVAIGGESNSDLNLTNIQEANFGLYYCEITNPNVPGLTLRSLPDIVGNPFPSDIVLSDYFILLNLYNSTNGIGWNTTWDLALSPTTWNGITIENQRVVAIDLANNNLLGTLASDLGLLDSLQTLDLGNNELSGVLPTELGNLDALTTLNLGNNELSGVLPTELGNLDALITLNLGNNELSGVLPTELGNLDALITLNLGNNEFSGPLPNTLANLTNLFSLRLENNAFTSLADLTALQLVVFRVQNNQLDFGDLQPNIGLLTNYNPQQEVRTGENYTLLSGSNLILSVDVGGTGNLYQWFYNSNAIATATNASLDLMDIQTEASGLYYCEISNPNVPDLLLTSSPDSLNVVPNAAPTSIALSNNSIDENLAIGTLIGLFSTTDPNSSDKHTYTISDNTNFRISQDSLYANISFDYETIASYDLTVTSTDLGGLTYSDALVISIIDVDDGGLVTAIEDIFTQTEILLYPNPSTSSFHISGLNKIGVLEIIFYNLQGQTVKEYSEVQNIYDVSDLPKGFYIAVIKTLNSEKTINFIIN